VATLAAGIKPPLTSFSVLSSYTMKVTTMSNSPQNNQLHAFVQKFPEFAGNVNSFDACLRATFLARPLF
jgi:hypothetical protein